MHPHSDWQVVADDSDDANDVLAAASENNEQLTDEGFLTFCACGHGMEDHGCDTDQIDFARRAALAVHIDALLEVSTGTSNSFTLFAELVQQKGRLLDFSYTDDEVMALKE